MQYRQQPYKPSIQDSPVLHRNCVSDIISAVFRDSQLQGAAWLARICKRPKVLKKTEKKKNRGYLNILPLSYVSDLLNSQKQVKRS